MEKYTRKNNQFNPMSKEEFMKKEIERQRKIEENKVFKKFRIVVYEQKKSGGYPFADFETDNFYEGVSFAKKMMAQQKNYRANSEYLWVSISEFQPIHERSNVIYPYRTMVHFGENDVMESNFANGGGVGLKGNQSRIDMNHNGIIDAEDFKLLRSSMNGAWRNQHEHVNSTSRKNGKVIDYEVRYARKHNPSRKGYKGKSNFEDGGAVNLDFRNFTLNELSKSLPQDVSIMWLFQKKPEKFIRIYDKEWNKYATKHWTISDYGQMELSKGSENLYIDLKVYEASENAPEVEYFVTIYTKDNHNGLKEFSKNLIQKFATGGGFEKLSNSVAKRYEGDAVAPKYQRMYGKRYDKEEAKEVGNKVAGKVKAMQMQNKKAFGGLFGKNIPSISKPHYPNFEDKQVMLKNGEWVQVLDQSGDTLMVMSLSQIGTGASSKRINISEVEMN
jgi:hypothetical protein